MCQTPSGHPQIPKVSQALLKAHQSVFNTHRGRFIVRGKYISLCINLLLVLLSKIQGAILLLSRYSHVTRVTLRCAKWPQSGQKRADPPVRSSRVSSNFRISHIFAKSVRTLFNDVAKICAISIVFRAIRVRYLSYLMAVGAVSDGFGFILQFPRKFGRVKNINDLVKFDKW